MKDWKETWEYVKLIIIVLVVVLVVNNVVLINAKIPSESMERTIMTGDRIFGFRMSYGINFDFFGKHISPCIHATFFSAYILSVRFTSPSGDCP